jgi:hypothetical protein
LVHSALGEVISLRILVSALMSLTIAVCLLKLSRSETIVTRRERWLLGWCYRCGYDMRFSPARCPECGSRRPYSLSDLDRRCADERAEAIAPFLNPGQWPRGVWLGIFFFLPFFTTIWACWRWSI